LNDLHRWREPEFRSGRCSQRADNRTRRNNAARPLFRQLGKVERRQQVGWPAAIAIAIMPSQADIVERRHPLAGKAQGDIILVFADRLGLRENLWLIALAPETLGQ